MQKQKRRNGFTIMAKLIVLVGSLAYIMLLAVVNGLLGYLAALGTTHYKVEKRDTPTGTTSQLRELTADERVAEIAQMLSGSDISEAALQNARELLNSNKTS